MYNSPCSRQPYDQMSPQVSPNFPLSPSGTALPSGLPLGPAYSPFPIPGGMPSMQPALPPVSPVETTPQSLRESYFTAGFLRTQIGRRMRVEFLIGTNGALVDRTGTLIGVGTSYILLQPDGTNITIMADLFSIKFVTIYPSGSMQPVV